jgi:DNA-binding NarL/FixJ family response regulator
METRPVSLIVVEDATLVRRMLMHLIAREPDFHIVAEAENGRQAIDLALELRPEIILMDVELPVLDGIQAARQILALAPRTRIVLLTAHSFLVSAAPIAGNLPCIDKNCTPTELVETIRKVLAEPIADPIAHRPSSNLPTAVDRLAQMASLTERERSILHKLVEADHTSTQIARSLTQEWKYDVTEAAVKHTIERVMNKMRIEPRTRTALIKHVMEYERQCL